MTLAERIQSVLREAKKPLSPKQMRRRLDQKGWTPDGENPDSSIRSALYGNTDRFVKVRRGVYRLADAGAESTSISRAAPQASVPRQPASKSPSSYTYVDCAYMVLDQLGDGKPMSFREITDKAIAQGWLITKGRTPHLSMHAAIVREITRFKEQSLRPRFTKPNRGLISLSKWDEGTLNEAIDRHNDQVRQSVRDRLLGMSASDLEGLITDLLLEMDFQEVDQTRLAGDKGVDVRGTIVVEDALRVRLAVQVKGGKTNVQRPIVQKLRGSIQLGEHGLIVTTAGFSKGAIAEAEEANKMPISLMNGEKLIGLLLKHEFGAKESSKGILDIKPGPLRLDEAESGEDN